VFAGAGLSFGFDWGTRRVRIKPSVQYIRQEFEMRGVVQRAIGSQLVMTSLDQARLIRLAGSETNIIHGLGGGLEIETDAMRLGSVVWSVFLNTQFYSLLGNRDFDDTDVNAVNESADFHAQLRPWMMRAGAGVRFRWQPE